MELTPRGKALSSILFALHDKPERVPALLSSYTMVEPRDAAILFGEVWTNSESLFENRPALETLIHFVRETNTASMMMKSPERERLKRLKAKKTVTLFRGAGKHNIEGFSWTVNRKAADFFAVRNGLDGYPIVVKADFLADDLVAYLSGRSEFEVIVDLASPTAIEAIERGERIAMPYQKVSAGALLAWKVQAFGDRALFGDDHERQRISAMVMFAKRNGTPLADIQDQWNRAIAMLDEFPGAFAEKRAEMGARIAITQEAYAMELPEAWSSVQAG